MDLLSVVVAMTWLLSMRWLSDLDVAVVMSLAALYELAKIFARWHSQESSTTAISTSTPSSESSTEVASLLIASSASASSSRKSFSIARRNRFRRGQCFRVAKAAACAASAYCLWAAALDPLESRPGI